MLDTQHHCYPMYITWRMVVYVIKTIKKIYVAQGFPLNKTLKYSRNKHRSSSHNKFLKSLNSKHFKGKKERQCSQPNHTQNLYTHISSLTLVSHTTHERETGWTWAPVRVSGRSFLLPLEFPSMDEILKDMNEISLVIWGDMIEIILVRQIERWSL